MAQQYLLRAEDPGLVPTTNVRQLTKCLEHQLQGGSDTILWPLKAPTHMVYILTTKNKM